MRHLRLNPVQMTAALVIAIGGCGLLTAVSVRAFPEGAAAPALKLSIAVGPPTTALKANGSGFPADDAITVAYWNTTVATGTASSTGTFTARFRIPVSAAPGPHTIQAFDSAGVVAMATFTVQTDWAMARFSPTGSGFNPYENVLGPANVGRLLQVAAPQWGAYLHSEPLYVGGLLIAGSSDGTVREFDTVGDQRWSFAARGPVLGSPVAVIPRQGKAPCAIAFGARDGNVYGLNPRRGTRIWTLRLRAPVSGSLVPVVQFGAKVVAVSDTGKVAVVNGCTGKPSWTRTLARGTAPPEAETPVLVTFLKGDPDRPIIIGTPTRTVALDANTGKLLWTARDSCQTPPCSPLTYGTGKLARVIIGAGDPTAVELNARTGQRIWSTQLPAAITGLGLYETPLPGSPAQFTVQSIIVADRAGDLESLNPRTGRINWGYKMPGPAGEPAIANGVIYDTIGPVAGTPRPTGELIAINGGGRLLFSADTADLRPQPYPPAPPAISDGRVYVGDFSGGMRVFALVTEASS
jgi:outer membrane protein assembly factor BamB